MYYLAVAWLCTCECWLESNYEVKRRPLQAMKGQKTEERQRRLIGKRLSEPALARISLDHHFANINDKASTKPYKFLCNTKEFSVASEIYHIAIFSLSLLYYPTIYDSWIVSVMESIDKVSLNSHIWLLDCQCRGSVWQSFNEWPLLLWPFDCQ